MQRARWLALVKKKEKKPERHGFTRSVKQHCLLNQLSLAIRAQASHDSVWTVLIAFGVCLTLSMSERRSKSVDACVMERRDHNLYIIIYIF